MITKVLLLALISPPYFLLFVIWWQFLYVIKMTADVENVLNVNDFFGDTVDILKEGLEQHRNGEYLKGAISKGKLLAGENQWTHERVNKGSNETINKTYAKYKYREFDEKDNKIVSTIGKHVISLYSTDIYQVVKMRDVKKLQQDFENDLITRDQMANIGCLLVCTFANVLAPVLVAAYTVNNSHTGHKGYKSA